MKLFYASLIFGHIFICGHWKKLFYCK